jgi:hypothetical protein
MGGSDLNASLGQRHHRHQSGIRHEMLIIKHRRSHSEAMRHLHRQCLSELGCCSVRTTIIPAQRALSSFRHTTSASSSVDPG